MGIKNLGQQGIVFAVFAALFAIFAIALPGFLTTANMLTLLQNVAVLGILGLAMAIVVIGRGIDISLIAALAVPPGLVLQMVQDGHSLPTSLADTPRGPSFEEFNFALYKNTALGERVHLQLRAEVFNLFNHPNFANPILPGFIADPGTPSGGNRFSGFLPITTTGDVGIGNPFIGGGGPRGIQLAVKIMF